MILHLKILNNMEVIVKSSPKIEIELATKVVKVGGKVTVDSALSSESENPVMNKVVTEKLIELSDEKADKNGKYADLTAGDLYGHGESVEAEFSFRASGGKSIKDGTAYVKEVHGNAVVWNQLYHTDWTQTKEGISISSQNGIISAQGTTSTSYYSHEVFLDNVANHKYLFFVEGLSSAFNGVKFELLNRTGANKGTITNGYAYIFHTNSDTSQGRNVGFAGLTAGTVVSETYSIHQIDLTQMFGAGNEPTTIEDFYRLLPTNIDINEYNEGEVIPFRAEGIKSVGDNAWDEEWRNGHYSSGTGVFNGVSKSIANVNPIKILPNSSYIFNKSIGKYFESYAFFYDDKMNFISYKNVGNGQFTSPSNAVYMNFYVSESYYGGNVYNHDITISLYHSGWKAEVDNTYKPYWEDTLLLDSRIKEAFPNGMYRAGSAYDIVRYNAETKEMEAVKRIKAVKMKDLNWSLYTASNNNTSFTASLQDIKQPSTNAERTDGALIAKYYPTTENPNTGGLVDKCWVRVTKNIYIKDDAFASAEAFVNSLNDNDVLYYELAEPIVTPLGEFEMDYKVADFGTEEIISEQNSAPFKGRVIYQFNAVDQIRENYNEIEKIKAALAKAGISIDL